MTNKRTSSLFRTLAFLTKQQRFMLGLNSSEKSKVLSGNLAKLVILMNVQRKLFSSGLSFEFLNEDRKLERKIMNIFGSQEIPMSIQALLMLVTVFTSRVSQSVNQFQLHYFDLMIQARINLWFWEIVTNKIHCRSSEWGWETRRPRFYPRLWGFSHFSKRNLRIELINKLQKYEY